ncbi:MAG TPA: integrase arm-type DNA-binding domain-containing protein, partial [Dyella sp.]
MSGKTTLVRGPGGRSNLHGKALTAKVLSALVPGDECSDPDHPGLRCRCVEGSPPQRVFFYRYRNAEGSLRQVKIGVLGAMTLVEIRSQWQTLQARVRSGGDPREEAKTERAQVTGERVAKKQAEQAKVLTVGKVVERYLDERIDRMRKPKGAAETRRILNQLVNLQTWAEKQRHAPRGRKRSRLPKAVRDVAQLPAAEFTRIMAHDLLAAFGETAPRSGAVARAELRGAWRYGIEIGLLPGPSPLEKVPGARKDTFGAVVVERTSRARFLSREEAGQLLRWMAEPGTYSRTVRDVLEIVLRTGMRSGEVCAIHSRELSWREGVLWLDIPADRMKSARAHSVPLVGRVQEIVA